LKDVKHVSKGKKEKEQRVVLVINCMEKVLFQVIRGEISFFEQWKKNKKKIQKRF